MSIFDDEKRDERVDSFKSKDKMPKTPDFTEWGKEPRKGNPFALSDWGGGSPANISKP